MATFDFFKDAVRFTDNSVNVDATVAVFRAQLEKALSIQDTFDNELVPIFNAAFALTDVKDGKRIPKKWTVPALAQWATFSIVRNKDISFNEQQLLNEKVMVWIKNHSCAKREDSNATQFIRVSRGRGGVQTWANTPKSDD